MSMEVGTETETETETKMEMEMEMEVAMEMEMEMEMEMVMVIFGSRKASSELRFASTWLSTSDFGGSAGIWSTKRRPGEP